MPSSILASVPSFATRGALAVGAAGAGCVAYGMFIEHTWYRSARYQLEILPAGAEPLSILHVSDLHFIRRDRKKREFLASLPPADVAVVTGDMLGEPQGVEIAVEALGHVRGRLASYIVLGSNDYYVPQPINPLDYLIRDYRPQKGVVSRWRELVSMLEGDGWEHIRNRKTSLEHRGTTFEIVGLDDPHIKRHDLRVAPRERPEQVGLAIVHSPDPAPELAALGYDLILAGHTHGGQVRLPFLGAIFTNSLMPTKIGMGMSRFGPAHMHISPGLGTSKYAPFRFLCRPEATYLELLPKDAPATMPGASRERGRPEARS